MKPSKLKFSDLSPDELRRFIDGLKAIDPIEMRAALDPKAWELLADEAWWEWAAPLYAVALVNAFEHYGEVVEWWESPGDRRSVLVRATHSWRWDDVAAELLLGLSARLCVSTDASAQLLGLKAQRWLGWWRADAERQRRVAEVLGVSYPPPAFWPATMVYPMLVRPAEPLEPGEAERLTSDGEPGHAAGVGWEIRSVLQACMGVPVAGWDAEPSRRVPRPWLWCWELESMPPGVLQWSDEGDPIVVPVVVPHDFDEVSMPDRYGFAGDARLGEPLVVTDSDRILAAWSGRLVHHAKVAPGRSGFVTWHRDRPFRDPWPSAVGGVVDVDEIDEESELEVPGGRRRPALVVVPKASAKPVVESSMVDRLAERDEARRRALDAVNAPFDVWRGR